MSDKETDIRKLDETQTYKQFEMRQNKTCIEIKEWVATHWINT